MFYSNFTGSDDSFSHGTRRPSQSLINVIPGSGIGGVHDTTANAHECSLDNSSRRHGTFSANENRRNADQLVEDGRYINNDIDGNTLMVNAGGQLNPSQNDSGTQTHILDAREQRQRRFQQEQDEGMQIQCFKPAHILQM